MKLPKKPYCIYAGMIFVTLILIVITVAHLYMVGVIAPDYYCAFCKEPQRGRTQIYGLCEYCEDNLIFQAQREFGYKWGKIDAEVMALVRKYIKELPRIRKEGRVERK